MPGCQARVGCESHRQYLLGYLPAQPAYGRLPLPLCSVVDCGYETLSTSDTK
ncbi:hypothetical protein [Aporhodopirellula aestuarii]|uniref:Uncharacterized protein n=1 Tax=Aporhodopirellula aestuarii TaxID=2950107 RepID=A0ABT0TZX4_9BACT|nr:hypothetical protein [Aporhodopirellula aestuarii]MCM2370140.1 hypothetical protein [Aporhodopirellula aestuarii]